MLGAVKIVATCLTVGSGGSAGDFGPSLVIGGLFGGAFGRAAQLLLHDPRIDPGAFALVGMGTFYGGLAHVPIASLVMTCELAGSYDLLVPLMFAEGIAFVALRNRSLYHAQVATKRDSPAHREDLIFDVLTGIRVSDVLVRDRPYATFTTRTPANEVIQKAAAMGWQDVFPVLDDEGKVVGIVLSDILRTMAANPDLERAHDRARSDGAARERARHRRPQGGARGHPRAWPARDHRRRRRGTDRRLPRRSRDHPHVPLEHRQPPAADPIGCHRPIGYTVPSATPRPESGTQSLIWGGLLDSETAVHAAGASTHRGRLPQPSRRPPQIKDWAPDSGRWSVLNGADAKRLVTTARRMASLKS